MVLAVVVIGPSAQAADKSLAGVYACKGTNPDGQQYAGFVEIPATGSTYHARWTFPETADRPVGAGFVRDGRFVIGYSNAAGAVIVAVYDIHGKTLKGHWTAVGSGRIWDETLERQPAGVTVPDPVVSPHGPHGAPGALETA